MNKERIMSLHIDAARNNDLAVTEELESPFVGRLLDPLVPNLNYFIGLAPHWECLVPELKEIQAASSAYK